MTDNREYTIVNKDEQLKMAADKNLQQIAEETGLIDALGAKIEGELYDLRDIPPENAEIEFVTYDQAEGKHIYWHTASHVLAHAVKRYVDGPVKLAIGPPVDDGFYYDFDLPDTFSDDDLYALEGIIKQIIKQDLPIERYSLDKEEAIEKYREKDEPYKLELIEELEDKPSFYSQGEFEDLCGGPHLLSTGQLGVIKLTRVSGAYWRGNEEGPTLQRVYGIAFQEQEELEEYERKIEEAKKRDHRRLGEQLDLFHIEDDVGAGMVIWHPKGGHIRTEIENYWRDRHQQEGYQLVYTPHLAKEKLWKISGHLDHYAENMFPGLEMEGENYRVKPMNCPFHMKIFNSKTRSYRDLPLRLAELGTVYRYEKSGVLHGLLRVRGFTQDDAHIFCRPDQLEDELVDILEFTTEILTTFGFEDYEIFVSTQPDDFVGSQERWDLATTGLQDALEAAGLSYEIDPGEGVYYGPKIDLKIRDSLDREWQCSTIQVDFNVPERFDVEYINEDGEPERPIMIHRALFGSLERFFGCLVEHYGGAFPPWLVSCPVWILPISDENLDYAEEIDSLLGSKGINSKILLPDDTLGKRIKKSIKQKIPFAFIVGSDEEESGKVEMRRYGEDDSVAVEKDEAISIIKKAIEEKKFIHTDQV
ncbi:MAG: threonine--tRNA ligase [bacterium]